MKIWISDLIIVKKVLKSEKSLEKFFEITVQTKFGEETQIIPTAILNKKDIVVLKKYFNFNEYFSDTLIKYLVQSSENSPHIIKYEEVGWFEYSPNVWFFRTNKVICSDKKISEQYCYDGNMNLDNLISDNEEYLSELNELLNTEGTMFAVVVGLSSALLTLLQKNTSLENILIHIFGDSSSGKTTFLQLAVSMWGKPDSPPLVNEWNSTANAIYSALAGNEGITVGFDEASCCSSLDYSTLIYNLSHGHDKAKCNKDSTLREKQAWNTTIVSTAEESLLDKTKKNNGIRARCLEFFNMTITFTQQAQKSRQTDR